MLATALYNIHIRTRSFFLGVSSHPAPKYDKSHIESLTEDPL
jgi:hypothetical protein